MDRNIVSEKAAIKEFDRINNEYRETRYTYEDGREIIFILEKLVYI